MAQQICRVVVKGTLFNTVQTRNVFDYGCDRPTAADPSVANGLQTYIDDIYTPVLSYMATAMNINAYDFLKNVEGEWIPFHTIAKSIPGTNNDGSGTYQLAALITAGTASNKSRGRKFLPGFCTSGVMDGVWLTAVLLALSSSALSYITPASLGGDGVWYPGVTRKDGGFAPFTSSVVGSICSTMRRRKPGYGI